MTDRITSATNSVQSDLRIHFSFFSKIRDVHPDQHDIPVDRLMHSLANQIWMPAVIGSDIQALKQSVAVGSGGIYPPGATRGRDQVVANQLMFVDVDNTISLPSEEYWLEADGRPSDRPKTKKTGISNPVTFTEAVRTLESAGLGGVVYTTASHTSSLPRIRIALPLAEAVPADVWPQATDWILRQLALDGNLESIDLPHLRNPAAVAILPTHPIAGRLLQRRVDGEIARVPIEAIRGQALLRLPPPQWQQDLNRRRLERTGFIRPHPIWQAADPADLLRELGCQVFQERPWVHGTKCRTTCPWSSEHTGGVDDDAGVVFYPSIGRPGWKCAHAGHAHMGVWDLLRATGRI